MTKELVDALNLNPDVIRNSRCLTIRSISEPGCSFSKIGDYNIYNIYQYLPPDDSKRFSEVIKHDSVGHGSGDFFYSADGIYRLLLSDRFDLTANTTATIMPIGAQSPVVLR